MTISNVINIKDPYGLNCMGIEIAYTGDLTCNYCKTKTINNIGLAIFSIIIYNDRNLEVGYLEKIAKRRCNTPNFGSTQIGLCDSYSIDKIALPDEIKIPEGCMCNIVERFNNSTLSLKPDTKKSAGFKPALGYIKPEPNLDITDTPLAARITYGSKTGDKELVAIKGYVPLNSKLIADGYIRLCGYSKRMPPNAIIKIIASFFVILPPQPKQVWKFYRLDRSKVDTPPLHGTWK